MYDRMTGAGIGAFAAFRAQRIVDDGEVFHHCNRACGTGFRAFSAPDTPRFAGVDHRFSAGVRGTGDVDFRVGGNAFEETFRAAFETRSAGSAKIRIDRRATVHDACGVFRAVSRTGPFAEASVFADFPPAVKFVFLRAVERARVSEFVLRAVSAATRAHAHGRDRKSVV